MKQLNGYSDERRRETVIACREGHKGGEHNKDHIPTKALLSSPYPENLLVVRTCKKCNSGFSRDEEYLSAFLASVICGSTNVDPVRFPVADRILAHSPRLRERIDQSRQVQGTLWGDPEIQWTPEFERITRVIVKNARGHILYDLGQSIAEPPSYINIIPIQRMSVQQQDQLENPSGISGWPEVGNILMQRIVTGESGQGGWIEVQDGIYRYAVSELLSVRIVLREYLAAEVAWDESIIT